MRTRRVLVPLLALPIAATAVTGAPAQALAHGGPPHHNDPHHNDRPTLIPLDLAGGQQPENLTPLPSGASAVTFALTGQVAEVSRSGKVRLIAQLPVPARGDTPVLHGKAFAAGIARAHDGTLYVALSTGTAAHTGIWRVPRHGRPSRIAALPADSLLNGIALDERRHRLYVADSTGSAVWTVSLRGGAPKRWASGKAFAPTAGFLGANGLRLHDGAVWVSNLDAGTLLRVPVGADGRAGAVRRVIGGLGSVDDFAFTGRGDEVLVTDIKADTLTRVAPGKRRTTVLNGSDGLSSPTAVSVRGRRITVTSAAYFTERGPNVLSATIAR
ncbi:MULTISPECIES: hypothetical protein [unclassified Streptomyces]|uniref:hypothetical protein n=1 Tax=unclassified Streptomyces TaxID=2593676 RepID=UPI000370DFF2|nr:MULTISPECIES: hypothetical protein [unclassified Streptomyces]MYY04223.1 hypothetical protein [Streptomyces sp. SID4913]